MKIVQLITRLIRGGAQRIALESAAFLRAEGHDAVVWCGPETGPEGSLHEEAATRGIPVRVFPDLVREVNLKRDLQAFRSLARAMSESAPDWVHTHSSKAGILGREAARWAEIRGVIHTSHGWGFTPETSASARAVFAHLERRAMGQATRTLFVSRSDYDEGRRLGIVRSDLTEVLPPGIDLAPYRSMDRLLEHRRRHRERLGWDGAVVGGFLGRLAPQKDPALVLEVARKLALEHPGVRWLVVGEGPLGPTLRDRAAHDSSLLDRVVWAGLQKEPSEWLSAMDFLLVPSRWEGAPLVVMEAMAAGLPVVASDLPGIRGLLDDGASGFLAPPGDAGRFALRAAELIADPGLRRRVAQAARGHALRQFGLEPMLRRLLELYSSDPPFEMRETGRLEKQHAAD